MIIGENREKVVDNIRLAAENSDFYAKVELNDPILSSKESKTIVTDYLSYRNKTGYKLKSFIARIIVNTATSIINRDTEIVGEFDSSVLNNGAIITSNHFGPLENTIIRHFVKSYGKKLNIVSQVTNFAMTGFLGFIMNYSDTIPLPIQPHLLAYDFISVLQEKINKKECILIYPEQEMWFNYRKPRPPKKGAYHFAAKLGCPIVSCFVEIIDKNDKDNDRFRKTKYRLHILGTLYPDKDKTVKENSESLCNIDYELKTAAYESCYNKPLTYDFSYDDIAGWIKEVDE